MRVLFLVRPQLTASPGGDTTQIVQTAAALQKLGVRVEIAEQTPPDLSAFDLAHLFHLDRLWENHAHARRLKRAGLPYVLSTIWWPAAEFDRAARGGAQGWLSRTFGSGMYANLRIWQRAGLHVLRQRTLRHLHPQLLNFHAAARFLLGNAAFLLPNSAAEADEIAKLFHVKQRCAVVPNAADLSIFGPPPSPAPLRRGVLCVGRIEPRKNQLNLIRAVRDTPLQLTCVGPVGGFAQRYLEHCRAAAGPNVQFLPAAPPERLRALYHEAAVHACVSWYETPGLASLEAAVCGCALVVTPGGCTREYFGAEAEYAEPAEPASIRAAIARAQARGASSALAARIQAEYTWAEAARATLGAYQAALGAPRGAA